MSKGSRRVFRTALVVSALLIVVSLVTSVAALPSNVTWSGRKRATQTSAAYYKANTAQALDVSYDNTTNVIHSIQYRDYDPATGTWSYPYCAQGVPLPPDECPFKIGVFYARSMNDGTTFQDEVRMNAEDVYASRVTVAAMGDSMNIGASPGDPYDGVVVAAWATQSSYYDTKVGSGPRSIQVKVNTNYGDPAAWGPVQQLTKLKRSSGRARAPSRVDYPSLAAAGGRIYLTYTDSNNGKIHLQTSIDGGVTWSDQIVATSSALLKGPYPYGPNGYGARPSVGVSEDGMTVILTYLVPNRKGDPVKLMGIASVDGGATWIDGKKVAGKVYGKAAAPSAASGATDRVGVAYVNAAGTTGYVVEYHKVGGWQAPVPFATLPDTAVYIHYQMYTAGVGLQGTSKIGVAFGGCYDTACKLYKGQGIALMWTESSDGGATFTDPELISEGGQQDSPYWNNFSPTVVWDGPSVRLVGWTGLEVKWWGYIHSLNRGTSP